MVLPFWRVCTLKNREKLKLLKLVALIWQLRWGRMVVVVMRVCWNEMFSGGKNMNLCVGACVLCLYSERTLKQPRWLKAETAEVAESHIYGASSTHTRQIWSNARFTRGPPIAKPIFFIHAQKPTVQLFLSSSQHERLKKNPNPIQLWFSKGSLKCCGEMPDGFTAHFPYGTDASLCGHLSEAFVKGSFWQKANIARVHSGLASRALGADPYHHPPLAPAAL